MTRLPSSPATPLADSTAAAQDSARSANLPEGRQQQIQTSTPESADAALQQRAGIASEAAAQMRGRELHVQESRAQRAPEVASKGGHAAQQDRQGRSATDTRLLDALLAEVGLEHGGETDSTTLARQKKSRRLARDGYDLLQRGQAPPETMPSLAPPQADEAQAERRRGSDVVTSLCSFVDTLGFALDDWLAQLSENDLHFGEQQSHPLLEAFARINIIDVGSLPGVYRELQECFASMRKSMTPKRRDSHQALYRRAVPAMAAALGGCISGDLTSAFVTHVLGASSVSGPGAETTAVTTLLAIRGLVTATNNEALLNQQIRTSHGHADSGPSSPPTRAPAPMVYGDDDATQTYARPADETETRTATQTQAKVRIEGTEITQIINRLLPNGSNTLTRFVTSPFFTRARRGLRKAVTKTDTVLLADELTTQGIANTLETNVLAQPSSAAPMALGLYAAALGSKLCEGDEWNNGADEDASVAYVAEKLSTAKDKALRALRDVGSDSDWASQQITATQLI